MTSAQVPVELGPPEPFSFERLIVQAKELAQQPYQRRPTVPSWLTDLPPQQWRAIRYRPDRAVPLGNSLYSLQLFHLGSVHRSPVRIHLVEEGNAREVLYDPGLFDFGTVKMQETLPKDAGFAGFRIHYVFDQGSEPRELLTFLGASYFRAVGRNTRFGISARGLALETGLGKPEEFPAFTKFWIFRPNDPRDPLQICALLDSPSVAGAYRFDVTPRDGTMVAVDASLFFRADVSQVGLAPLTSMFFFGPNDRAGIDDSRLQVHDSDGLAIWRANGEALWRPLVNPDQLRISVFGDENPRGFGLLQRERAFGDYGDLDARFEQRPNLWVEPKGAWGKGSIRLIEIPILDETHDNIVAFWTPEEPVNAGRELRVAYSLLWSLQSPIETGLVVVLATRIGQGGEPGGERPPRLRRVVVEFGPPGPDFPTDALPEAVVECHNGKCSPPIVRRNDVTGGWQVSFDVDLGEGAVELRCFLSQAGKPISETWLYRLDHS
ncbi:glucan biosynthesis protein [Benzoatithermus flavus]|uniref:Glucan biosynthesis protein n=1 Tax=Benzoatithermus flavus TaxID=3108223 RepID=A0ABU8XRF5_9PROT